MGNRPGHWVDRAATRPLKWRLGRDLSALAGVGQVLDVPSFFLKEAGMGPPCLTKGQTRPSQFFAKCPLIRPPASLGLLRALFPHPLSQPIRREPLRALSIPFPPLFPLRQPLPPNDHGLYQLGTINFAASSPYVPFATQHYLTASTFYTVLIVRVLSQQRISVS